ncbi:MAG TPA: phosphodiester glycosidase family protein [Candidatus Limiplasma sp.]|nr:phosphodiester glycosidase family protein [Candidatus Limiplasma sp.]
MSMGLALLMPLTLPFPAFALTAQDPCTTQPYDYQYQDGQRAISINRVTQADLTYFVVDIQLADVSDFHAALSGDQPNGALEPISAMASRDGAVLAINGDDYGANQYGTIIRNGALLRSHSTTRNMLIVDARGDMSVIADRSNENPSDLSAKLTSDRVWQTFEFGPELVRNGQAVAFNSAFDVISTSPTRKEPRTAIGQIGPLHYVILVVDGRQEGYSAGITLQDLQQLFVSYGAQTAMNLDGGGSTELWFQGQILNQPCGGEERYVSDAIYF